MAKNILNILIITLLSLCAKGADLSFCCNLFPKDYSEAVLFASDGAQEAAIAVADTTPKAAAKKPKKKEKQNKKGSANTSESKALTDSAKAAVPQQTPPPSAPPQGGQPAPQNPAGGTATGMPPQGPPPQGGEPMPLRSNTSGLAPQQGLPPQVVGEQASTPTDGSKATTSKDAKKKKKKGSDKKVTFETFDANYVKAVKYYNNSQYLSAARIFEELYPLSMGTPQADTILFLFADCYYKNKDFEMAAFHFKDYAKRYPGTDKAEYAYYLCVKSVFEISPVYSLDQSSTLYAIDEMDLFIKNYPHSPYVEDCNHMLDLLHEKLAKKDFEVLKLYYNTDHFQAVQIAAKNFLKEHPSSSYAAESVYILIKSNFEYARKSVQSKKRERFQACVDAFDIMQANFPNSLFYADAKKYRDEAKNQISKLK